MSERHGVQEATLRNWANLGYITSSRINNQLFLDDESLTAYLEAHKGDQCKNLRDFHFMHIT